MMVSPWIIWLAVGIVATFVSAVFSGTETGIYCLSRIRLRLRVDSNDAAALRLERLLSDRNRLLAVILIGNNVANYATTLAATFVLVSHFGSAQRAELITTVAVTPVLFVFGEMVPKNLFHRYADKLTYSWSWILAGADRIFTWTGLAPLVRLLAVGALRLVGRSESPDSLLSAREQIRGLLLETATLGTLSEQQTRIAENVLSIRRTRVADVMTPVQRVRQLPLNATYDAFLSLARSCTHSRLPVHPPGERRSTVGVLTVHQALLAGRDAWDVEDQMTDPCVLRPEVPVMAALARLQKERVALAVIADPAGRTVGIVTLKDLVEEIVGELRAW